jgi:hypothetical protein
MVTYPKTNILVTERHMRYLSSLQSYFDIKGTSFYQNPVDFNSERADFIYFLGDSAVFIKRFEKKADIKICAYDEDKLSKLKKSIENILSGCDDNPIST